MISLKNSEPAFCMSSIDMAEEPGERVLAKAEILRNVAVEIQKKSV